MTLRQVEIGRAHPILWRPSALPAAAPTMTFAVQGASASVALVGAVQREGVPVTSVMVQVTGSKRLGPDPNAGAGEVPDADIIGAYVGEHGGHAWLDLGGDGAHTVRPMRVDSDGIVHIEHQSHGLPVGAVGRLHWNVWAGTLGAGALGGDVKRVGRWEVQYTAALGGAHPGEGRTDGGPLRLVRRAFATGLGSDDLATLAPRMPVTMPRGQSSWTSQVVQTLPELVQDIEGALENVARGDYADQLDGGGFREAHALLVYRRLVEAGHIAGTGSDVADARARYWAALQRAVRRATWIDTNGDGVIDDDEGPTSGGWQAGFGLTSHAPTVAAAYAAGTRARISIDPNDR